MRVVQELQQKLYGLLVGNEELKKKLTGIYNYVPQDTKFPYLYLGKITVIEASTTSGHGLQINFELELFARERGNKAILEMSELIEELLEEAEWQLSDYQLLYLRLAKIELGQQNDGLTYLANFKIKAYVMREVTNGSK